MKAKILYHVRTPSGVSVDMREDRGGALRLASDENYEVYEVNRETGHAIKIRSARAFKVREYEDSRPVVTLAANRAETRQEIGFSFSQSADLAEAI